MFDDSGKYLGTFDDSDRQFFDEHFKAIAQRMNVMRIYRNPWRVEFEGCVYKFKVDGYLKKGSSRYELEQAELRKALADDDETTRA